MAALNFPNSPSVNDIHTENGVSFKWNGTIWKKVGASYLDTTNLNVTGIGTFAGAVNIGGVLTYEDVKNVDSVGIVTARQGLRITGGGLDVVGVSTFNNHVWVKDNQKLISGTQEDLSIYHLTADNDGYIKYQNENGHLKIGSGVGGNGGIQLWDRTYAKEYLTCDSDGAVKIFFNDSQKFQTTNTGVTVSGAVVLSDDNAIHFMGTSANDLDAILRENSSNTLLINSRNDTILNIDSNGDGTDAHFAIGHGAATGSSTEVFRVQENGEIRQTAASGNTVITLKRSNTNTTGTVGGINFAALDGHSVASIQARGDGNDEGAHIQFYTTSAAAGDMYNAANIERLRITSGGNIGIGTHDPQSYDSGARSLVVCGPGGTLGQSGITIASGSDKYGSIYFADGTGSSSYRGRVEYRHDNDELLFGAGGAHGDLLLNQHGDMFLRGDSTCYLVLGSSGDSTQSGANNNMNWIRGNGTNVQYNCCGGFHAWENSGGQKMKLNGDHLELTGASQCKITMGSTGTPGTNDSNWIRGDGNRLMYNCASTSGDHTWEINGTAYAKVNTDFGLKADNTCKAWLCYRSEAGSEQIMDDFGVASVTDEGTGKFWVNLDNNIHRHGNGFYQSIVFGSYNASPYPIVAAIGYAPSHGSNNPWWDVEDNGFRVNTQRSDTGAVLDAKVFSVAAFGDTGDLSPT